MSSAGSNHIAASMSQHLFESVPFTSNIYKYSCKNTGSVRRHFKFNNLSMNSKYIAIRRESDLSIINTFAAQRTTFSAFIDHVIAHPSHNNILALRSGKELQIFNLNNRKITNRIILSEQASYWRWIDTQKISIISSNALYHWNSGDDKPIKLFDIESEDRHIQYIRHDISHDGNWILYQGIAKSFNDHSMDGVLQIYNKQLNKLQPKIIIIFLIVVSTMNNFVVFEEKYCTV